MKSDINGCSTCMPGCENYESFTHRIGRQTLRLVQYDYRTPDGELFSCVAPSLANARALRDNWLKSREY